MLTFNDMPQAIEEILARLTSIEKILQTKVPPPQPTQSALITHRKALEAIDKKIYGVPQ
jgi:hypothetical protein